jgi:DNA processing protein
MFPARNRLMAALAGITVVVEAAERSGSLITAEMALEGGRLVGAVPGPVNSWRSSGTNRLLADGAAVVRHAQDVLDLLLGPGRGLVREAGPAITLDEEAILAAVEAGSGSADAISRETGLVYPAALAGLGRLERAGYVSSDATGRYARTAQVPPEPGGGRGVASTIGE